MQVPHAWMPHQPPIRMIDRAESLSESQGRAEATLVGENPFIDESDALEPVAFVEMVAQAYVAWKGLASDEDDEPLGGMLVAVNSFEVSGVAHMGDQLVIDVEEGASMPPFYVVDGTVRLGDQVIASASLRVVNQ